MFAAAGGRQFAGREHTHQRIYRRTYLHASLTQAADGHRRRHGTVVAPGTAVDISIRADALAPAIVSVTASPFNTVLLADRRILAVTAALGRCVAARLAHE